MNKKTKEVGKFYDRTLSIYNLVLEIFFKKGRVIAAKALKQQRKARVIDLGCNQGQLASLMNENIDYIGVDASQKCIKKGNKTFQKKTNIVFIKGNAENTPYPKETFDFVFVLYALSVTPEPEALLCECKRLLKEDGKLIIVNHFSSARIFRMIDRIMHSLFYTGVHFYFPFLQEVHAKGFNIVKQKQINWLWTYLELKKT